MPRWGHARRRNTCLLFFQAAAGGLAYASSSRGVCGRTRARLSCWRAHGRSRALSVFVATDFLASGDVRPREPTFSFEGAARAGLAAVLRRLGPAPLCRKVSRTRASARRTILSYARLPRKPSALMAFPLLLEPNWTLSGRALVGWGYAALAV